MIKIEMCADRGLYKLDNRFADLGIYNEEIQGFYILKMQDGDMVLDTVRHVEMMGAAIPIKYLRMTPCMPDDEALVEYLEERMRKDSRLRKKVLMGNTQ